MASYTELHSLFQDSELTNKIRVAVIIAAKTISEELDTVPNHTNRLIWSRRAFSDSSSVSKQMMMAVLAANNLATVAQILAASDASIQSNVESVINLFADGT